MWQMIYESTNAAVIVDGTDRVYVLDCAGDVVDWNEYRRKKYSYSKT